MNIDIGIVTREPQLKAVWWPGWPAGDDIHHLTGPSSVSSITLPVGAGSFYQAQHSEGDGRQLFILQQPLTHRQKYQQ